MKRRRSRTKAANGYYWHSMNFGRGREDDETSLIKLDLAMEKDECSSCGVIGRSNYRSTGFVSRAGSTTEESLVPARVFWQRTTWRVSVIEPSRSAMKLLKRKSHRILRSAFASYGQRSSCSSITTSSRHDHDTPATG